jgi:hypothetical protein
VFELLVRSVRGLDSKLHRKLQCLPRLHLPHLPDGANLQLVLIWLALKHFKHYLSSFSLFILSSTFEYFEHLEILCDISLHSTHFLAVSDLELLLIAKLVLSFQ